MDALLYLLLGVGLSAACGFRVFVPLAVIGLAGRLGQLQLAGNMEWITSTPALTVLAAATIIEVGAYYIPWVDNVLDSITTPLAILAGTAATAAVLTGADPVIQWSVGLIAGGTTAGAVQLATVAARAVSTLTTGGLGNPVVSTLEAGAAAGVSVGMVVLPVAVAGLLVAGLIVWAIHALWKRARS